jgi:hypothetical protein
MLVFIEDRTRLEIFDVKLGLARTWTLLEVGDVAPGLDTSIRAQYLLPSTCVIVFYIH